MENKSNKKQVFIITILIFLFSGCFSVPMTQIVVDKEKPQEETAVILVRSSITITNFNGKDVKDEWYPKDKRKFLKLTIPAGETNFVYNMFCQMSNGQVTTTISGNNIKFSFNFEAGKEYTVGHYAKSKKTGFFSNVNELYIAVWDRLYTEELVLKSREDRVIRQWLVKVF